MRKFKNAAARQRALGIAQAKSRNAEAQADVLRRQLGSTGSEEGFRAKLEEAQSKQREAEDEIAEIEGREVVKDLSGVTQVSDSRGNFPLNADVAQAGGIGADASNSAGDTDEQAEDPEQVEGDTSSTEYDVEIDDDWESLKARDRRKLAGRLHGGEVATTEEADDIIREEYERRNG